MNNVHDMGGMTGYGPVLREPNEPIFHDEWERRVFATTMLSVGGWLGSLDTFRHAIERMGPLNYLKTTYYEHWLAGMEIRAAECDLKNLPINDTPLPADVIDGVVAGGVHSTRDVDRKAKYAVGDVVRAKNIHSPGHTRLPRYARGHVGTVELLHGNHVYPDTSAHALGEQPQPLYTVRFTACELWGDAAPGRDSLCVDLWEEYLEDA